MIEAEESFNHEPNQEERWMIFGKTGWIGGQLEKLLEGRIVYLADSRLENRESIIKEIDQFKPTHVLNAAGVTGRPNVDWCETNKIETIRANVIGALTLADVCREKNIHCTMYATGCIFTYGRKTVFNEEDKPNFDGSFYSKTKGFVDQMLKHFDNVLVLRIRMPISDDMHPRNFLTKITKYTKIHNVPNSMSVLSDLLPVSLILARRKHTGIYNLTNPGVIEHNECLELHRKYIDPDFEWENIDEEELKQLITAPRSNNELSTDKLRAALPEIHIPHIKTSVERATQRRAQINSV